MDYTRDGRLSSFFNIFFSFVLVAVSQPEALSKTMKMSKTPRVTYHEPCLVLSSPYSTGPSHLQFRVWVSTFFEFGVDV
jgi:hypothetical protein